MKGSTTLKINLATMIEAMQMYLDSQLVGKHTVTNVKPVANSYTPGNEFEVELGEQIEGTAQAA